MVFLNGSGNVSYVSPSFYLGEKRILISFYFWKASPIITPAMLECRDEASVDHHSGVLTPRWILAFLELLWFLFEKCKSVLWHRRQTSSLVTTILLFKAETLKNTQQSCNSIVGKYCYCSYLTNEEIYAHKDVLWRGLVGWEVSASSSYFLHSWSLSCTILSVNFTVYRALP